MGRKIQFRRGPEAERLQTVLANGEPGWSPETEQLFIGDGQTLGGQPLSMGRYKVISTDTQAAIGGKYMFNAGCKLHLPDNVPEGSQIQFNVLTSANLNANNKAKIIAPAGKSLRKDGETGTEYHTSLIINRTAIYVNSEWEIL
ncbi:MULTISPECIES: hypothetical protein [Pseudoalteromonas]|uniref:Major tropism determinant N-terminal domain-containing protein n=1 Tax=Pseudoalteromonas amylolytica TaxID=1859457 RepID=A0A1S1MVK6_9GAMM|nr:MULTISPECIES: hypothetical protein [Pseudoalteromonas]OHU87821.1 hypothetical protein BFC16_10430 [Pseudoalteromonas sp. JW3]OHU91261.1 hypothetical protein BET10_10550 [Pseudoalteromonas amylolytica]